MTTDNLGSIAVALAEANVKSLPRKTLRRLKANPKAFLDSMIDEAKWVMAEMAKYPEKDRDLANEGVFLGALYRIDEEMMAFEQDAEENRQKTEDYIRMISKMGDVATMVTERMDELGIPYTYSPDNPTGKRPAKTS